SGGGQPARMMVPPAAQLGLEIAVLAEAENSSASSAATRVGDYSDVATVLAFAVSIDVVTFDHAHAPQEVRRAPVYASVAVHPCPDALLYAQDKLLMRQRLSELGLPVPGWASVETESALDAFINEYGGRAVVKTPRGGYDGKGVRVVASAAEVADWFGNG